MAKFRKRPIVVEAEQFWPDRRPWPEGVMVGDGGYVLNIDYYERRALMGGDWVVRENGSLWVYRDCEFRKYFEPVEENDD